MGRKSAARTKLIRYGNCDTSDRSSAALPQGEFRNEPFTDFSPENARAMQAALDRVASQLGHEYDLVIGGHG